jgi:hypothetical protein
MADDTLRTALVELVRAASIDGIRIYLGGGYGLYLKQLHLVASRTRTFLPTGAWPRPRATADLDIFLPTEIVSDLRQMTRLREILDRLAYQPVAKFMHFQKEVAQGHVRVELLTGPLRSEQRERVQIKRPRVRPRGAVELHAYLHEEAVALDVEPWPISLGDGVVVLIPNAFSLLVMKLHACRDRLDDPDRQLGRHHALDVYRVLAMLSEPEERLVRQLCHEHRADASVRRAAELAAELFADVTSRGALRMREHALASEDMQVERALELLGDLLRDAG